MPPPKKRRAAGLAARRLRSRLRLPGPLVSTKGDWRSVSPSTAASQAPGETVYYKYFTSIRIESGDSLWTLADTYADGNFESREAFIREVIRTNHLLDENINAGDYLIIPYYSAEFK